MAENNVETELLSQIKEVLLNFLKYWEEDVLLRSKVAEDLRSYDQELIKALLSNKLVKDTYSIKVGSTTIFKIEEFISMLRYKNYWDNSFTKYTNEIGLTSEGKYLKYNTDVVLDFPHKDSVLEGGMSKDDEGREEIYYHNTLAKEEIDTLLSSKILTNIKKYDENGNYEINEFTDKDNLIIKGNNLIGLHSLKEKYNEKVKMIYIDPPYNTGNDSFKYNDRFNHSTWLTFIKNRLEIAKELLSDEGVIFVHVDRNQFAELKILMDEIFKNQYLGTIVNISAPNGRDYGSFAQTHDYIHVFAKNIDNVVTNNLEGDETKFSLNDNLGPYYIHPLFNSNSAFHKKNRPNLYYPFFASKLKNEEGYHNISLSKDKEHEIEIYPPLSQTDGTEFVWRWGKEKSSKKLNIQIVGHKKNDGSFRIVQKMRPKKQIPRTVWHNTDFSNRRGTEELQNLFSSKIFSFPKPEHLLNKIIEIGSNEGDIVLDFFMGSATTQAVAHKMNRQYIGIEQMDYINTVSVPRLQKVIEGEQGGISKDVDWEGGGSFVYVELSSLNDEYVKDIQTSKSEEDLESVLSTMKERAYLNFKVDLKKVSSKEEGYKNLSLEEKKEILIQVLDMNQLYLSYSEMEDEQYKIPEDVKVFNHSFYQKEGENNE